MGAKEQRLAEAVSYVNELIDEKFGSYIEKIVTDTDQPELRDELRDLFFKYLLLGESIKAAKDIDDFEALVDKSADLLEQRIHDVQKKLAYYTEIKKAKLRQERAEFTKAFYSLSLESLETRQETKIAEDDDPDMVEAMRYVQQAEQASREAFSVFENIWDGFEEFEGSLLHIRQHSLVAGVVKFRRWRRVRKLKQALLRLFWNVIIFGYFFGVIISSIKNFLSLTNALLLAAIGIAAALVKEYKISPWLRRKRLNTQRKDLLSSLKEFMAADINFKVLAPLTEKRTRERANDTTKRVVEKMREELDPN
jgi:hypothetical protein